MVHASEGLTHWYTRAGEPCYTVVGANGKERPATLRDARKLDLVPSVTGILKCQARPGLELWQANQLMMSALTLPRLPDEPETAWLYRVRQDSQEQARKAADRGTAIHAAIQSGFQGEQVELEYLSHWIATLSVVCEWAKVEDETLWKAERPFAHPLGFGGKTDLHSPGFVIDFKSKEFDGKTDLSTYDEHAQQLAAYREGLEMPTARCAICYVSVTVPGLARVIEIPEDDLKRGWECFKALLLYWKAKNRI